MSDLFEGIDHDPRQIGGTCTVKLVAQQLDEDDRSTLQSILSNPRVTSAALARRLRNAGHEIGNSAVARHRRRDCKCSIEDDS